MVDSRVLQVGGSTSVGAVSGLVAGLLGRLIGRNADVNAKGHEATDRELASLASETPERRFELGKSQALALKSGFSGGWLA